MLTFFTSFVRSEDRKSVMLFRKDVGHTDHFILTMENSLHDQRSLKYKL
jgi:hypothetical protein